LPFSCLSPIAHFCLVFSSFCFPASFILSAVCDSCFTCKKVSCPRLIKDRNHWSFFAILPVFGGLAFSPDPVVPPTFSGIRYFSPRIPSLSPLVFDFITPPSRTFFFVCSTIFFFEFIENWRHFFFFLVWFLTPQGAPYPTVTLGFLPHIQTPLAPNSVVHFFSRPPRSTKYLDFFFLAVLGFSLATRPTVPFPSLYFCLHSCDLFAHLLRVQVSSILPTAWNMLFSPPSNMSFFSPLSGSFSLTTFYLFLLVSSSTASPSFHLLRVEFYFFFLLTFPFRVPQSEGS